MNSLNDFSDISIVIPVREGSSRIKEKIHLPFTDELSLLEWKISQVKKFQSPDLIFVSSDSEIVYEVSKKMGVKFIERSHYLCNGHDATFSEVICGVVEKINTPHFAWVTVVVPLMSPAEYQDGFKKYNQFVVRDKKFDSLVSVNLLKEYIWDDHGPINYQANRFHTISQELPNIYRVTNGLYMRSCADTLREGYFLGPNPYRHVVGKIAGIDIDEIEDYQMALSLKNLYKD